MELRFEKKHDTLLVRIKGELDAHTADGLKQGIEQHFKDYPSLKNMIMELNGVGFIDSSGIGVILGRYKNVKQRGGNVGAVGLNVATKRIFELSGMTRLMSIYDTLEEAERDFGISGR